LRPLPKRRRNGSQERNARHGSSVGSVWRKLVLNREAYTVRTPLFEPNAQTRKSLYGRKTADGVAIKKRISPEKEISNATR